MLFVFELKKLLCYNINITTICFFCKKIPQEKKYIQIVIFFIFVVCFIRKKVDIALILAGYYDVVQYNLLRKRGQSTLLWQELNAF